MVEYKIINFDRFPELILDFFLDGCRYGPRDRSFIYILNIFIRDKVDVDWSGRLKKDYIIEW